MPRKKRSSSPFELMDDDFDEDSSSQCSRNGNPPMRNAANARERARMRVLSSAFGRLKTKLPNIPADTKLSKLDTLRLATMYIKQLKNVVEGGAASSNAASLDDRFDGSSILNDNCFLNLNSAAHNMSWPFGFHHQVHSSSIRTTSTSSANNGTQLAPNWCQTEENISKQQPRYNATNYEQHQPHHDSSSEHSPPATYIATSLLPTPITNNQNHESTWYSETPSPDLSNSPTSAIGYDNVHHHHHQQQPQHQRSSLMEHLSLIQLSTPPPPSSSALTQQQPFQNHHHHHNHGHHSQHSLALHHHHSHIHQHLTHHHSAPSSQHLHQGYAATSIR